MFFISGKSRDIPNYTPQMNGCFGKFSVHQFPLCQHLSHHPGTQSNITPSFRDGQRAGFLPIEAITEQYLESTAQLGNSYRKWKWLEQMRVVITAASVFLFLLDDFKISFASSVLGEELS